MKAHEILQAGARHMEDRAKTYDNSEGERSIPKVVKMFNILADTNITDEQGWLFMALLKMVRTQQGQFRSDSYEDLASYSALAGEEAEKARGVLKVDTTERSGIVIENFCYINGQRIDESTDWGILK